MNDTDVDELGPVDYIVVEFPADKADFSGAMAAELTALIKRGTVRVLDLLILKKDLDGSVEGFESHDFGDSDLAELLELETELAMLLAADDVEAIGAALEPGSVAAVLIWENVWAAPFGAAVRQSGGQLVASGRIPIQAIAAAVEADEAAMKEGVWDVGSRSTCRRRSDGRATGRADRCGGRHGRGRGPWGAPPRRPARGPAR
jgi:Family of unknown function (DUF6325)